jgi:hypothetical protein
MEHIFWRSIVQHFFENDDYEILTPFGWEDFSGLVYNENVNKPSLEIMFLDGTSITATYEHRFYVDGTEVKAEDLKVGMELESVSSISKNIIQINQTILEDTYDIFNSKSHIIFANDVKSHQCDEMAFLAPRVAVDFWSAIGPTLATGGKCIITSTPNSDEDQFAQIWYAANRTIDEFGNELPNGLGSNDFKAFIAYWYQHPDRDEEWAKTERAKFGYEKFSREYDLKFLTADSTLIDSQALANMISTEVSFKTGEVRWWERPQPNKIYCISLDPSAGVGKDFAAIQVWRLPEMVQVGEWMHNKSDVATQIKTVIQIAKLIDREQRAHSTQYNEPEIFWTFENNSYGQAVVELINEFGLDSIPAQLISETGMAGGRPRRGLNTNGGNKSKSNTKLKSLIESNQLEIKSKILITQLKNYVITGAGFAAKSGEHDDLVSAMLLIVRMSQLIAKWDDSTALQLRTSNLLDIDDLDEGLPMSMGRW